MITFFLGFLSSHALLAQSNTTPWNQSNGAAAYYLNISKDVDNKGEGSCSSNELSELEGD